ncbi:putative Sigma factor sigB regulation protein rsbU [Candidatus Sulfotelmatomonas gaucii]|uniref:Putative Sigma factor sigB regulation protein rsbU n=1 Tax=Candidatus Sulfuritelmatomonas gaucii TaxID=2043161 RepID=A0A2N9LH79_9BACT|nr:putative Sigma factor sigB regulation protein rsbU [Candidatus Sulfotelmatomonas gaucii]
MSDQSPPSPEQHQFEGDYRPADASTSPASLDSINVRIEPADFAYLMRLTDALNTTLDLQTLLARTSELVRAVIPYRIFAIFLLNERANDLRMRFQIGHTPQVERTRVPVGKGVVGQVALTRQPILLNDVSKADYYIDAKPDVRSELAVPLINKNRLIGVMDIESEQADFFRPEHLHVLTMTASRIAQAIENARLYARVSRQAQTLEVLNEIAVELASILDLNPLLERVGQLLRRLIDYQMFTIMLLDEKGETLITRYAWRFGYTHAPMRRIPTSTGLVGAAVSEWRPINVPDVSQDPRYLPMNPETKSELIVPLFYKGRVIGVLDLEHTRTAFFNEAHERMLTTLASQIAIAIENARLYQAVRRQERQLEKDIAMAREVQLRLLPNEAPSHPHADMAVRFLPARTIGGDLYDFLDYGPNRTAIMLGDVSGKAAPAALFAALVSGIMRAAAAQQPEPAKMLTLLNDALQERKLDSQYVTMLFVLWNDENQTLQVANSGAVQPVFCRAGESVAVKAEGFPLGMFPNVTYEEFSVATQPGDAIVFVSDGILDAENEKEEMYGQDRLSGLLCASRDLPAQEIAEAILADVSRFQGSKDRFDDETIIVLRVR